MILIKFTLVIDEAKEEEVVVYAHQPSPLTQRLQQLVQSALPADRLPVYQDEDTVLLDPADIACITVSGGKTWVVDRRNRHMQCKLRLYELEALLPPSFIRLSKSALGNETQLERFAASFSGAVDAIFQCGHREYVSRRCFAQIKRRYHL